MFAIKFQRKNMKHGIILVLLLIFSTLSFSQDILKGSEIQWQDLEEKMKNNPQQKNFLVFIYADWCEYCQQTAQTTLKNKNFIHAANNDFIPVKMNANSYETIHILDTDFTFDEESGYHGLPIVLLDGNMEFPSYVFLTPEFRMIETINGHQNDANALTLYMDYISSEAYKTVTWKNYQSNY